MENKEKPVKKPMTDEERLELAMRLDKELDDFIESLPKRSTDDGWPEDRWEEEMEKHPFFMQEAPRPGQELHPLYEGLQQLKYDPEENEPEELAISYKEDGNFNFKHKNYRLAVVGYTEGIKIKCGNPEIESSLYNNRSAAHFYLKNYRSSLHDCKSALEIKPDYEKALARAANCCYHLERYKEAIDFCDQILDEPKENQHIKEFRLKCIQAAKLKERDERKKDLAAKKKAEEEEALIKEILSRDYEVEGGSEWHVSIDKLEPHFPELMHNRVFLDAQNNLVWPVALVYPEYKIMDYIQQFNEKETLLDQLSVIFEKYPEWDEEKKYTIDNINVYFETSKKKLHKVDINDSLRDVLKIKGYIIKGGTPSFIVMAKDSKAEAAFLKSFD